MRIFLFSLLLCRISFADVKVIDQWNLPTETILNEARPYLPENPVIIEAGAWNGWDTVKFAHYFPAGTIYSFEPLPENFQKLVSTIQGYVNIHPFPCALSDEDGTALMYVSEHASEPGTPSGSSSLLPPKEHLDYDSWIYFPYEQVVDTLTIDTFCVQEEIEEIDFMWLDMQGFELNALAPSQMAKKAKLIYAEVEFVEAYAGQYLYHDLKAWLETNGFEIILADFDEKRLDEYIKNGRYFGNILFRNQSGR